MATVNDIANRSLRLILVKASALSLTDTEVADYIEALNSYMASLEAVGIRLGFTPVSSGTDTVTVPDSCLRGIVANMAIEVAAEYNAEVSEGLAVTAREGMKAMRRVSRQALVAMFPDTLPIGSGHYESMVGDSNYYGNESRFLLTFKDTATTFVTANTPVKVNGEFHSEYVSGFRTGLDGIAKYTGNVERTITLTADLVVSAEPVSPSTYDYTFHIYQNGVAIESSTATLGDSEVAVKFSQSVTAYPGDEFQLFVENDDNPAQCVVRGRFSADH